MTRHLVLLVTTVVLSTPSLVCGDGGAVRLREHSGPYLITAFTSPTPFRQGIVDISVMVQLAATCECVPGVTVTVRMKRRGTEQMMIQQATSAAATNKLLQAALFDLSEPGWWEVEISINGVEGQAQVRFVVQADQPMPRWQSLWIWYTWPALAIIIFAWHQLLMQRRGRL